MIVYLITRDNKNKYRFYILETINNIIKKRYGQIGGKAINAPDIVITSTTQGRTLEEQITFKFKSEINKLKDKGYIEVLNEPFTYTPEELNRICGNVKVDQSGIIKPQLAKPFESINDPSFFNKEWMISPKLDGVKALFYYKNGEIHTASRGGSEYDVSTKHLRTNSNLIKFFESNPTTILDGELYVHNKEFSLQRISGACRTEDSNVDTSWIQYWIYDCYITNRPKMKAADRQFFLIRELNMRLHIPMFPEIHESIILLTQYVAYDMSNIMWYHDSWVKENFEGAVIKDPNKPYKPGSRCNNLIKIKMKKEDTYKVINYCLGSRGSEDMVFVCELPDGRTFKASPVGDRKIKEEYVQNFEKIYKDQLADVTYFNLSDNGIPTQPFLQKFRFDLN